MTSVLDFNTAGPQIIAEEKPRWKTFTYAAENFRKEAQGFGLLLEDVSASDGNLVRCPVVDDKPGNKSGWFVFYTDGIPAGAFGNWKNSDESISWSAKSETDMTPVELQAHQTRMARIREVHIS